MYTLRQQILPRTKYFYRTLKYTSKNGTLLQTSRCCHRTQNENFVRTYAAAVAAEPFINGTSSTYVEEMYDSWKADPKSVHKVCCSDDYGHRYGSAS